uniref:NADH-ubiquinone oxidoreductase chain 3 n=1 Tax=Ornithodoros brasiliensis TaxID=888526 RepID=W0FIH0_ORNBR|nr:NADH dehydrogenase subunit 3 [Ornithodoros brasiliensis]AHF21684.1 NADH dehydrogenase subunit 3 [Ornithodoros brasiliensis]QZP40887.1 NADH dehydrogenase subunit 3 [Ornithodoros brasiliensis]
MKFLLTSLTLTMIITSIANSVKKKFHLKKEKNSPFECGFDPFSMSRTPFSIRFFMIAIIFIIFDIEIIIILPFPMFNNFLETYSVVSMSFIIILILAGLIYEWYNGMIKWLK